MRASIFDLFYIGIGPSSSHTIGPMRAAKAFVLQCQSLPNLNAITVTLYGSLALTGKGHHTDKAVLLGLMGESPEAVDIDKVESYLEAINKKNTVTFLNKLTFNFNPETDLIFKKMERLEHHTNGITFKALSKEGTCLLEETMYSIGGGSILTQAEITQKLVTDVAQHAKVPYPFKTGKDLLEMCEEHSLTIAQIMQKNELITHSQEKIDQHFNAIWAVMQEAVKRGMSKEGILPGGLNLERRAADLASKLVDGSANEIGIELLDWLSVFAIATNEENAAGGRVVTAPTNGSAGIIPAVLMYYNKFVEPIELSHLRTFFLTSGAIGFLYKTNASLSGAEMGCQGEVGVACSMAAGGLAALMGGSPETIECAAEIGMEHHLGLTCDPIKGLVQIPCIERNSMGAVKAVNAARLAMKRTDQKISLDRVIKTMKETGNDMKTKYKETSEGGLALHHIEC